MQRSIICPHCHTGSNHGVCGALVGSRLQATAGWITCGAVLVAGMWAISRLFRDRVVFKRVYRTR